MKCINRNLQKFIDVNKTREKETIRELNSIFLNG